MKKIVFPCLALLAFSGSAQAATTYQARAAVRGVTVWSWTSRNFPAPRDLHVYCYPRAHKKVWDCDAIYRNVAEAGSGRICYDDQFVGAHVEKNRLHGKKYYWREYPDTMYAAIPGTKYMFVLPHQESLCNPT